MKLTTPEIVWHGREPVFSVDFHRNGANWRLATAGADNDVKMWKVVKGEHKVKVEFMSSLSRHTKAVNVVRFSPNGEMLASAGDDSVLFIWKLGESTGGGNLMGDGTVSNKENWTVLKALRGHLEDVYDVCWSFDSNFLVSGSVDNTAIVWDIQKEQKLAILSDSKQYVQGVAWDPLGQYLTTISNDRSMRIYSAEQKFKCLHTISKISVPDPSGGIKQFRMWADESLSSFFRRLTFTPDGSLLIVPAGKFGTSDHEKAKNCTYIFARNNLTKPVLQLPGPDKATIAVRCCPVLFDLLPSPEGGHKTVISLPYRMVYAVASLDAILLYDTQHSAPFSYISNIHYASITDLSWSSDGQNLAVASSDGYCSIVSFDPGELGTPLPLDRLPSVISRQLQQPCKQDKLDRPDSNNPEGAQPRQLEQLGKQDKLDRQDKNEPDEKVPQDQISTSEEANKTIVNCAKPRRIRPTTVDTFSSPEHTSPPTSRSPTLPQEKTVDISDPKMEDDASKPATSPVCEISVKKSTGPRRINFITLNSFAAAKPKSPSSELSPSQRSASGATHKSAAPVTGQLITGGNSKTDSEDQMEVQIIE